jgi:hypothetical protein
MSHPSIKLLKWLAACHFLFLRDLMVASFIPQARQHVLLVKDSDWVLDHVICTAAPFEFAVAAGCITRDRNHSSAYIAKLAHMKSILSLEKSIRMIQQLDYDVARRCFFQSPAPCTFC